jgi:ATP-binding protein involved in chromosome partitioning
MKPRPKHIEPTEDGQRLRIVWRDDHVSEYEPRALRLACPCATCVDEFTGRPLLDPATVPEDIKPVKIEYVGRYALKLTWPDGHDTGYHTWQLLRSLCPCAECRTE